MTIDYDLVRFGAAERVLDLANGAATIDGFAAVATHPYNGIYNAGSLPWIDDETTGKITADDDALRVRLTMQEPEIDSVLAHLAEGGDFLDGDVVSVNLLVPGNRLVQLLVKPDGRHRTVGIEPGAIDCEVDAGAAAWQATVTLPWTVLGSDWDGLATRPLPFDIVRFQRATGVVSSWAPLPDQLPFNDQYDFPVFCFGLLGMSADIWERTVPADRDPGRAVFAGPERLVAGSHNVLRFVYTVGAHGLAPGGSVLFNLGNEVIECNRRSPVIRHLPEKDWSPVQWADPRLPGYAQATCSRPGVTLEFARERQFSVTLRHTAGPALEPGDTLTLTVGEGEGPGMRTQLLSQPDYPFKFYADLLGNGLYLPCGFPTVDVVGRPAAGLVLHAPATPDVGEQFELKIVAVDAFGNIADGYTGTVRLYAPETAQIPASFTFAASDRGVVRAPVSVAAPAVLVVRAVDEFDSAIAGASNLIVTDGSFGPGRILFGDTHTHTQLSDGRLHPFRKQREIAVHRGLDFWAITDHDYDFTEERFAVLRETLERFDEPGSFATIPAYEWSPNMGQAKAWCHDYPGHRNVYFRRIPRRIYHGVARDSNTPARLAAALAREEPGNYVISSHFHCGNPQVEPTVDECLEISGWCASFPREFTGLTNDIGGRTSVNEGLQMRSGFGIVAGTDHGTEAYYTGLPAEMTAVKTDVLDREHVFDALKSGTVYACSGQKVLLKFTLNGVEPSVGSDPVDGSRRDLVVVVGSALPVINVQVLRNGETVHSFPGFAFGVRRWEWRDDTEEPASGYYYVRVQTAQGHHTWSSPVWFTAQQ